MSIDSRYTWDEAQDASAFEPPVQRSFRWWLMVAVVFAVVFHAGILWALGRLNLWLELSKIEVVSRSFNVTTEEEQPAALAPEEEEVVEPLESISAMDDFEDLLPELDDVELDIVPDLAKPKLDLQPIKPAAIGDVEGELLKPLNAPDVKTSLEELGGGEKLFQDIPEGRVAIDEGSVSSDIPDMDAYLKDAVLKGAGGLDERGVLEGYSELGTYLNYDVDQLDKGRAALPSDLLFAFNQWKLRESARLGLMKLAMLIDRNPEMYCILEGHSDLFGTGAYNLDLSRKRAQAVKDYLVKSLQLEGERIIVRPFGKAYPKVLEGDQDAQAVNRRVDILMRKEIPAAKPLPVKVRPAVLVPETPTRAVPVEEDPAPPPRAVPLEEEGERPPPRAIPVLPRALPAEPVDE